MTDWEPRALDRHELGLAFGVGMSRRNMFAICPAIPSPQQIERDLDALRETNPDEYAVLSEHIEVEKYRSKPTQTTGESE